jgi:tryptophanyl-tRNA synthetase
MAHIADLIILSNIELGRTVAERIVEFCSKPRYAKEINKQLGRAGGSPVVENYLLLLVEQGRLRRIEDYKRKGNRAYVAVKNETVD